MSVTHHTTTGPIAGTQWNEGHDIAAGTITEAQQLLADNTTGNVSTSAHGYAPKAPNDATKFLNGVGAYAVPASGGLSAAYFGYNTIGGSTTTWAGATTMYVKKFTTTGQAILLSIGAYIAMTSLAGTDGGVALYADAAGSPGVLLATGAIGGGGGTGSSGIVGHNTVGPIPGWYDFAISSLLAASTSYWMGMILMFQVTNYNLYGDSGGADGKIVMGDAGFIEDGNFRGTYTSGTNKFSMRALALS